MEEKDAEQAKERAITADAEHVLELDELFGLLGCDPWFEPLVRGRDRQLLAVVLGDPLFKHDFAIGQAESATLIARRQHVQRQTVGLHVGLELVQCPTLHVDELSPLLSDGELGILRRILGH